MADHKRHPSVFLLCMASFIISSYANQFNVGGRDGWVVKPSEDYNHWAGRLRFLVNDTLFFKYKKGSNSVLVVNKDDYDKCNVDKPITKLEDGNSIFKLDRSGPFYFISGNKTDCDQGQKLIVAVLAVRTPPKPPAPAGKPPASSPSTSPATAPAPAGVPPASSPSTSPTPAVSPISPPSTAPTPAGSPGSSPPSSAPTPAGSPSSSGPSSAPTPAGSPSSSGPSSAPTPAGSGSPSSSPPSSAPTPAGSGSGSPSSSPPSSAPTSSPPSPPAPGSPGPAGGSAPPGQAGANSPPPPRSSSARPAFTTPSTVLVSTVSLLVLRVSFGASIISL